MKAAVVGCGWMGQAVAYGMQKLGYEVVAFEPNAPALIAFKNKYESLGVKPPETTLHTFPSAIQAEAAEGRPIDFDVVISAAPFKENLLIGKICVDYGIRYCDLGGNPEVAKAIHDYALEKKTVPVFTDLGLAPGYVNILAEQIADDHKDDLVSVRLYCGGLPQTVGSSRLNYNLVFSVGGLINEYTGPCRVLYRGEEKTYDALSGLERFGMKYEAFYTRGGISYTLDSMKERGVQNCYYKTLRYTGHHDYMTFLMDDCGLTDTDLLKQVIEKACPPTKMDLVHIMLIYSTKHQARVGTETKVLTTIKATDDWTAMQMGTSFPTAAVAAMMAEGRLDDKIVATYADIDVAECQEKLYRIEPSVGWKPLPSNGLPWP
ncbi:MAG: saccharopine dehydrogenase C-terminal domain-containing protein [Candidatus Hermodarchaeia archaeon]|jgi:saccharopine dehydrogenase-like NADP-dependent oxidoreductase